MKRNNWKNIWEKKGSVDLKEVNLSDLISIDGFDTGGGKFPEKNWIEYVNKVIGEVTKSGGKKILEIGCGAGAFLLPFYESGFSVYGIDYSKPHVDLCISCMKKGIFKVGEANSLPFPNEFFDAIVSNSVFHYFPDLEYAKTVLGEVARTLRPGGFAAILDINDEAKREKFEGARKEKLGPLEYERLYGDLSQQFYNKKWFVDTVAAFGCSCEILEQDIAGYENSKYRFNAFFRKQ